MINLLVEKNLARNGIGNKSERRGSRSHQADVRPREREQQAVERQVIVTRPNRKKGLRTTRLTTASSPARREYFPTSPICFMARESKTSPVLEASTITRMAPQ